MVKGAWVTLATNDSYSLGALVLAHSLKQVGTQMELAILVTPGVTNSMRARLSEVFNSVKEVNILDSKDKANLKLLQRPELGITFTKLHCWQLTEYEKCVFLDADTLVLQNCDELFEREELSAAPDVGWPDCFNSGVFVYRPSDETYNKLIQFALDKGSFDGGDQGLLNMYFSDWASKDISKHLPFIYNVCSTAFYSYLPAFKQFGKDVKIIHFIGNAKPWLQYFDTESRRVRPSRDLGHLEPILQAWWNIFCSMIHPNLTPDMISSYASESVSARSPVHCPQQSYEPFPNDCTNYIPSVWDPWEVFDRKKLNVPVHSPKPLESHNTIALSPVANDHSRTECSNPVPEERFVDRNDQRLIDGSDNFNPNDQRCIISEFNPKEKTFFEHSVYVSEDTPASICQSNSETVQESSTTSPVPIHHQESSASAIPSFFKGSIPQNNPSHFASSLPEAIPQEFRQTIPEEIPLPVSQSPSKFEREEASKNVPCEVDCNVQESGLAGAFAKLTLGQHRTPEQEALENSLRRQNWEQGNIDYLGKDSFDNIWSKICETLAKGPEENEGDNSVQIANDGLVQPSPEQGSALEDVVLPPSQEVSKPADTSKDIAAQEKSPSDSIPSLTSADSPCVVPSEQITPVPQQPESLPAVTEQTPPKETISSAEKVPETTSAIVSEEVPLQKTPAVEPSPEVGDQISSDTPSAQVAVSDTAEDASKSKTIVPTSSETKASVEETAKSNIEQISSGTESSPEEIPKSVTVSDEKITPPTKDTLVSSLSEATVLQKEPLVESPKVPLSEPVGLESPSTPPKPEAPKQDIPPATVLMTPQKPSTPTTEQVPPLTEQIAVCPAKSISPVEETPSLKETTVSPAVQDPTPAPQTIPSTEQSPVLGISCPLVKPSAPVQSPEQKQVSSEKSPPSTIGQSAPLTPAELPKQADTGSTLPEISQQKATAPEPTSEPIPPQTSAVTQTPTAASDETPPPPITAPPRKNGGKKNQGKSKK